MTLDQAVADLLAQVDAHTATLRKRTESDLLAAAADFGHDVDLLDDLLAEHDALAVARRATLPAEIRAMLLAHASTSPE